jgi:hypothetical protein
VGVLDGNLFSINQKTTKAYEAAIPKITSYQEI